MKTKSDIEHARSTLKEGIKKQLNSIGDSNVVHALFRHILMEKTSTRVIKDL